MRTFSIILSFFFFFLCVSPVNATLSFPSPEGLTFESIAKEKRKMLLPLFSPDQERKVLFRPEWMRNSAPSVRICPLKTNVFGNVCMLGQRGIALCEVLFRAGRMTQGVYARKNCRGVLLSGKREHPDFVEGDHIIQGYKIAYGMGRLIPASKITAKDMTHSLPASRPHPFRSFLYPDSIKSERSPPRLFI